MLVVDLRVGDVVTKVGEDHKFIVTSVNPVKGLPQYITIMGPYGHADDVWINFINEKVGHIDIDYVFDSLKMNHEEFKRKMENSIDSCSIKRMSDKDFQDAFIEGLGDLSGDEFERIVDYISEKLGVDKEELLK